ncbi:ABC transporter ATP-binding protein [Nocardioides maradonensis]
MTRTEARPEASTSSQAEPLLKVTDLTVDVVRKGESVRVVEGIDLSLRAGERLALVGESGSGKSITAHALMRLNPSLTVGGSVRLAGTELLTLSEKQMRERRGSEISIVLQDPLRALNPLRRIGQQVAEPLVLRGVGRKEAMERAKNLLDELGVPPTKEKLSAYPHEFSGGMRQRVVIAIALIAEPKLLIADEPTTALDVRVQEKVLDLLDRTAAARDLAVLLITHDLGVVAGFADRVAVMYAGRKVEERPVDLLYDHPAHRYTAGLLGSVPRLDLDVDRLAVIPGSPVSPDRRPSGCAFRTRCAFATSTCEEVPALLPAPGGEGVVACHHPIVADEAPRPAHRKEEAQP